MNAIRKNLGSILSLLLLLVAPVGFAYAQVQVNSADPSSAVQGTVSLDVTVTGNGFDNTAQVKFLVTGTTNPGGIAVKKVVVNGSKKLVATIDVAETAIVDKFDIEVALSSGRKGKGTTLFAVQAKGKPTPPPPPPPPPPGSCSGAPGVFPAFAYTKARSHIETRGSRKGRRTLDGTDLYVANSTGSCSVLVATDAGGAVFRMVGSEARLAWSGGGGAWIKMLKLSVDNGNIVPVAPTTVYSTSWLPVAVTGLDWSPDGQTLYFADEVGTVDGRWVTTVKAINVASCVTNCPVQTIYTFPDDNGVGPLRVNAAGNRLYMSIHDRVPNIRTVSFLERQGSTWSSPLLRHVVSNQDSAYVSVDGLAGAEVGRWDHNNSSILSDVVMYVVERSSGNTIDIVDVSNCTASGVSTCLSSGESSVVRSGLALSAATFTTTPGWSASAPSLLVPTGSWADNTELVSEFDLGSMTFTPLVVGSAPDSSD